MCPVIRPAKPRDAARMGDPLSGKYWVIEDEGALVAWGGVQYGVPHLAVLTASDEAKARPACLGRACAIFRREFAKIEGEILARQDLTEPTSGRLLAWMGFEPVFKSEAGEIIHKWTG